MTKNFRAIHAIVFGSVIAVLYTGLLQSFQYGFDLTDKSYALYNLKYPKNEVAFSGFSWLFSPLGQLFGHHIVGYRILGLILGASCATYLTACIANVLHTRLQLELPFAMAASLSIALSSLHQALIPSFSYNDVMMDGVLLIAGACISVLGHGRLLHSVRWHFVALTIGVTFVLHARSVTGLALVVAIALFAIPAGRYLRLIERDHSLTWLYAGLAAGAITAFATAFWLGNPVGLYHTQKLMLSVGGGVPLYFDTFVQAKNSLRSYASSHWLALIAASVSIFLIQRKKNIVASTLAALPVVIVVANHIANFNGDWRVIACGYLYAGLAASTVFLVKILNADRWSENNDSLQVAVVVVLLLLLLPLAGAAGTSNNVIKIAALNLAPIGILLALPFCRDIGRNEDCVSSQGKEIGATLIAFILLSGITYQALRLRENFSYRVKSPLHTFQTTALTEPVELRGLRVTPEVYNHMSQLVALVRESGYVTADTRALSIYRSPGSVIATGLKALGPPWLFNHVDDAKFNCRLIEQALNSAPSRLLLLVHQEIREELIDCLKGFGFPARESWRLISCVALTAEAVRNLAAQTCVYETSRSKSESPG